MLISFIYVIIVRDMNSITYVCVWQITYSIPPWSATKRNMLLAPTFFFLFTNFKRETLKYWNKPEVQQNAFHDGEYGGAF